MGLLDLLQSNIVQTVAAGAAILGVLSGTLGAFAVLRRQSLLGDVLSHAALPGVCLGFLLAGTRDLGSILFGAFLSSTLGALLVLLIVRRTRLKGDAALGIVLSVFFAFGIVLLTVIQGRADAAQAGLATFLFGQAAAILRADLWILGGIALVAIGLVAALWKEFKLVTFDPDYARTLGLPVLSLEIALTALIALAVVAGLQLVGVVLMVALLVAPATAARQWVGGLGAMVLLAAAFGAVAGTGGALLSATGRGLATGPLVVLIASALVLVSLMVAPGRGLLWGWWHARTQRRSLEGNRVLVTLFGLAAEHGDARYPAETGMLDAFHGGATSPVLARLTARGLIRPVAHPPEATPHWELTEAGRASAVESLRHLRREPAA